MTKKLNQSFSERLLPLTKTLLLVFLLAFLGSCAASRNLTESGKASYYSPKLKGRKMANGEAYNPNKLTAAHKTLPFGTRVKVTSPATKKSVKVSITDRGPFTAGRVIDLSYKAAQKLGMIEEGVVPVQVKVLREKKKQKAN
ncbi:MAG TPA: septal ring lytic transglycosylase RlpA family protein [Adhaeribacter sp.]|nr:septal ring lytic transglycosylase RlpA family protein [Adhaeribacter sp.]